MSFLKSDFIKEDEIYNSLKSKGYIVLKNFFDENFINDLKNLSILQVENNQKERFSFDERQLSQTVIEEFVNHNEFKSIIKNINKKNSSIDLEYNYHYLINYSKKKIDAENLLSFHFDAFLYTIIIPINIRDKKKDEIAMSIEIIPNIRKVSRSMIINLFQKFLFQNKFFKKFSNTKFFNNFFKPINIGIKYDDILIFNGFRSLHSHAISKSNLEKEKMRLIIHLINPFFNNKINNYIFNNIHKQRLKSTKKY